MATTTPNYGWAVPTSTDLVKDGATAIETLGDAIDASMNTALGTKKAGMVLLNTTSFSAVASQSINSVFSATYDNYRILIDCIASTDTDANFRFRTSGTDNTASSYSNRNGEFVSVFQGYDTAVRTYASVGYCRDQTNSYRFEVSSPFLSRRTNMSYHNSLENAHILGAVLFENTTSFDGFTFYTSAGTITGSVSVYGYNK